MLISKLFLFLAVVVAKIICICEAAARSLSDKGCVSNSKFTQSRFSAQSEPFGFELVAASAAAAASATPSKNNASTNSTNSIFSKYDKDGKKVLTYYGLMLSGAVARSASATAVHPLNVMKTMLQTKEGKLPKLSWHVLSRGAGSQFIMSIPHGALNFAVTETMKKELARFALESKFLQSFPKKILNPLLDFMSSAISTYICSVISTPQMVITDRIMAGKYANFLTAIAMIAKIEGLKGFYKGWFPALVQKIPSYALTWMFFQQLKLSWFTFMGRAGTTIENTLIGSFAAAGACCVMIPIDTIKTRLVMQDSQHIVYHGMLDCFSQIWRHEGVWSLYRALPPRLMAVVPMIGIQFAVYELMKRVLIGAPPPKEEKRRHDEEAKQQELALTQELMKRWRTHTSKHHKRSHHHHHQHKGEHNKDSKGADQKKHSH